MVNKYLLMYWKEIKENFQDLLHKDTFYKQVPNILTSSRLIGIIPINILFFSGHSISAVILTSLILLTDFFDGKIARKWNIQSKFGADLDAVCDKGMFLGLSLPLIVNNPILIINFILEGIIASINVFGRINGLDTKTVFSGKVKTWFLSGTLVFGYLVHFFKLPVLFFNILSSITIGTQLIAIINYLQKNQILKEEKVLNDTSSKNELVMDNKLELDKKKNLSLEVSQLEELKKEREFYIGMKESEVSKEKTKKRVK